MEENNVKLSKKENIIQVIKFVLFSTSAGIIQTVTFTLLTELPPKLFDKELPYWACYLPALVLSVLFNFTVNRKFTFKSASNIPVAMLKVAAFYAVFTPVTTVLGNMAANRFDAANNPVADYLIFGVTMLLNLVTEFLYQKYFVFRDSINTNDSAKKDKE